MPSTPTHRKKRYTPQHTPYSHNEKPNYHPQKKMSRKHMPKTQQISGGGGGMRDAIRLSAIILLARKCIQKTCHCFPLFPACNFENIFPLFCCVIICSKGKRCESLSRIVFFQLPGPLFALTSLLSKLLDSSSICLPRVNTGLH